MNDSFNVPSTMSSSSLPYYITVNIGVNQCLPYKDTNASVEVCNYVNYFFDQCEGGGYLLWTQYILCTENVSLRIFFLILSIFYLLFLFLMMTTIADDFFTLSIATIVEHLKISQSIAGITLMAFGNGANGIFSIIASVVNTKHPKAGLAIGDLLGGGAFVTSVVFGTVILIKPFKIAKFATLRDICVYLIGISWMAFKMLFDGKLYFWEPAAFLVLYLVYVFIVVFEKVFKNFIKKSPSKEIVESSTNNLPELKEIPENIDTVSNNNRKIIPLQRSQSLYEYKISNALIRLHRKTVSHINSTIISKKRSSLDNAGFEGDSSLSNANFKMHDLRDTKIIEEVEEKNDNFPEAVTSKRIFMDLIAALNPIEKDFSEEKWFSKVLKILKFPIIVFVRLTVPQGIIWCKSLTLIHCFTMPLMVLFGIDFLFVNIIPGDLGLWIYAFIPSIIMFLIVLFFTSYNVEPVHYKSISGYFGFIVSVSWIYLMSSELVNVILMLSIVSRLSQEILGLTVMAWCNNMGDFIADTSVAKQGFSQMAASAAIAAPMFTMLIGFGTAFLIATLQGKQINISMDVIKGLLVAMIAASLITTLVTLFINKFNAKRIHGIILIVLYFIFLSFVILFDLNVIQF